MFQRLHDRKNHRKLVPCHVADSLFLAEDLISSRPSRDEMAILLRFRRDCIPGNPLPAVQRPGVILPGPFDEILIPTGTFGCFGQERVHAKVPVGKACTEHLVLDAAGGFLPGALARYLLRHHLVSLDVATPHGKLVGVGPADPAPAVLEVQGVLFVVAVAAVDDALEGIQALVGVEGEIPGRLVDLDLKPRLVGGALIENLVMKREHIVRVVPFLVSVDAESVHGGDDSIDGRIVLVQFIAVLMALETVV